MKKLMLMVGILVTSISYGGNNPNLKDEITEKLNFDLSEIALHEIHPEFVVVSFNICNDRVIISEITGTQTELIQLVKSKLTAISFDEKYDEDCMYRYKFTFEMH